MELFFSNLDALYGGVQIIITLLVTEYSKAFEVNARTKQLISWFTALVVVAVAKGLGLGFLASQSWLMTFIYGMLIGLLSNGLYDSRNLGLLKSAIELLSRNKKNKTTS